MTAWTLMDFLILKNGATVATRPFKRQLRTYDEQNYEHDTTNDHPHTAHKPIRAKEECNNWSQKAKCLQNTAFSNKLGFRRF
jgi:hypothetical protein